MRAGRWSDQQVEQVIGRLLQVGVLLAAAIVVVGGAVYLLRHGLEPVSYAQFRGEPRFYRTVTGILAQTFTGHGRGLIQLGLLVLIATPVARVAFALWAFWRERDRAYVVVSTIVLVILLYSLLAGAR